MLMFDMLVTFWVLLALLGLHGAWTGGGARGWVQAGAALGLGVLTKGPVVFLAPLLTALLAPWWGRRRPEPRWWLGLGAAVLLAAAVALAWALPAARAGGEAYGNAILFSQTGERIVKSFAHLRPWWWYLALLPGLLFPYSVWPPLWKAAVRLRPHAMDPGTRFCLAWTLPALAAFSLISGKQPHYLLPLLPGCALLAARLLDEPAPAPRRRALVPPLAVVLLVAGSLIAAPLLAGRLGLPSWVGGISPAAGVLLAVAAAACLLAGERICRRPAAAPALFTLLLVAGLYAGGAGALRRQYDVTPIARHLAAVERQGRPIGWVGEYHGQFHFLGRLTRPFAQVAHGAEGAWLAGHPRGRLVEDVRDLPPGVRTEYTQPYRTSALAVWGH
jgi:4-amino-4-deoxy-L-arabinose transferase-like glycosyltransferase